MTLVPNPLYEELDSLYTQLQRDASAMSTALSQACRQMATSNTWIGPVAQGWDSQLTGHDRDCGTQVSGMLDQVRQERDRTPAHVTPQEAQAIRKQLQLIAMNL